MFAALVAAVVDCARFLDVAIAAASAARGDDDDGDFRAFRGLGGVLLEGGGDDVNVLANAEEEEEGEGGLFLARGPIRRDQTFGLFTR